MMKKKTQDLTEEQERPDTAPEPITEPELSEPDDDGEADENPAAGFNTVQDGADSIDRFYRTALKNLSVVGIVLVVATLSGVGVMLALLLLRQMFAGAIVSAVTVLLAGFLGVVLVLQHRHKRDRAMHRERILCATTDALQRRWITEHEQWLADVVREEEEFERSVAECYRREAKYRELSVAKVRELYADKERKIAGNRERLRCMPDYAQMIVKGFYAVPEGLAVVSVDTLPIVLHVKSFAGSEVDTASLRTGQQLYLYSKSDDYAYRSKVVNCIGDCVGYLPASMAGMLHDKCGADYFLTATVKEILRAGSGDLVRIEIHVPVYGLGNNFVP